MSTVSMTVNGKAVSANVEDRTLLVDYIREHLRLTGTHVGCDTSQCGTCVVHVEGKAVKSCTMLGRRGRRRGGHDHRGRGERRPASDAEGIQ